MVNMDLMKDYTIDNFESICLAFPNLLTRISVALDQIEIKYIEELILQKPDSKALRTKLKRLRKAFEETAQSAGLAD